MTDWYFDFVVLFVTFFVITIGMTVYVRKHSSYSRYNKYVYTGIIPTITITTCEDMPIPVIVPPSEETEDNEENEEGDSCQPTQDSVNVTQAPRRASLTVPDLDDDDDDDDEQIEIVELESIPVVDSRIEEKKPDVKVYSQKEEIKTEVDNADNDDYLTDAQTEFVLKDEVDKSDSEEYLVESPSKNPCFVNGFTWKYGTSHTVEDPLFPFSETVEDEKPLVRNRFKKRLSQ